MSPTLSTDRRGFLKLATTGVCCWGLPTAISPAHAALNGSSFGRAKSVLLVLLSGGPSQLDTIDPKPDAPAEVRGEFSTISTSIPGVAVCEHLPQISYTVKSMGPGSNIGTSRAQPLARYPYRIDRQTNTIASRRFGLGSGRIT